MEQIQIEHLDSGVALVRLNRGVINALNADLVQELSDRLQSLNDDPKVRSVVLGSSNDKFFSIGLDIPQLYDLAQAEFMAFYRSFNQLSLDLYVLPKPTVAAITGHAIAGGCILALCCDYRFIAEGRKLMGLNEINLGLPIPYPGDRILRQIVGARNAREIVSVGELYPPEALLQLGMVDAMLPLEQVWPQAIKKAELLGKLPADAFALIKRCRVETVEEQIRAHLADKEDSFVARWYSDEARERLREAMKSF